MKKFVLIALLLLVASFAFPIGLSIANNRTVMSGVGPLRMYDTSLPEEELTPAMFADAIQWHERYSTNIFVRLFGLAFERRIKIVAVDKTFANFPKYEIQVYTYFNLPLSKSTTGAVGGEPTLKTAKPIEANSTVTIFVPEDYDSYKMSMAKFVQAGGEDPLLTTKFIEKEIKVPYTDDLIRASAEAAAEEIAPGGGPDKATITYFKIEDETAYILLDIDLNAWAGVSVSIAEIHPLIEKTLLQFPEINKVVFGYLED